MPKPSEIFDTPEAFSRVGDNKKPLRICNKTGVHTCRLGSIHLNEREAQILTEYLTTKDQEKEEAIRREIKLFKETIQEIANKIPANLLLNEVVNYAYDRFKALPTEDNN